MKKYLLSLFLFFGFAQFGSAQVVVYSLEKALKAARDHNPQFQAIKLNTEVAAADIQTAKLWVNPELNNQSLHILKPSLFANDASWLNALNMQVWWQLTKSFRVAGQRRHQINFAKESVNMANWNTTEAQRSLLSSVGNQWIQVWITTKKLNILKTALQNLDSLAAINGYRYQKQVITETELKRTQLIQKQYTIQLNNISKEYLALKTELKTMIGEKNDIAIDESETLSLSFSNNLDTLVQNALDQRSDIQYLKSADKAASENLKLQKSLAYPQPTVGFIYNPQNTIPYGGIFATLALPIFDRNQGGIHKAKVQSKQVGLQIYAQERTIETEIQNAFLLYQTHKQNAEDYEKIVSEADLILSNVRYAYTHGGTTIIDFLEAQRSWLETQEQYYEILAQYRQSQIQVLNVTGIIQQLSPN